MRRLKIVDMATLEERANSFESSPFYLRERQLPQILQRSAAEKVEFFKSLTYSLVLSNRGSSEAFRMSGGDYGRFLHPSH